MKRKRGDHEGENTETITSTTSDTFYRSTTTAAAAVTPSSYVHLPSGRVVSRYFLTVRDVITDMERVRRENRATDKANIERRYRRYMYRATQVKHIDWMLSMEQCERLFTSPCEYCDRAPVLGVQLNGIDRVDSSKGYTPDNTVPCCKQCNYAKGVHSQEAFVEHCQHVVSVQSAKSSTDTILTWPS